MGLGRIGAEKYKEVCLTNFKFLNFYSLHSLKANLKEHWVRSKVAKKGRAIEAGLGLSVGKTASATIDS